MAGFIILDSSFQNVLLVQNHDNWYSFPKGHCIRDRSLLENAMAIYIL